MRFPGLLTGPCLLYLAFTLLSARLLDTCLLGQPSVQEARFAEVAGEVGLDFRHFIGATGEFFFPENMGSGVALLDYDRDGDLDVYFLQGALLQPGKNLSHPPFEPPPENPPRNKLYRNHLVEEGRLRFSDVTGQAGVGDPGYGMGAAVGDYDNDGNLDLYVTNFGSNVLYRNNGDGTFVEVTLLAGVNDARWSTSAAFVDYDLDGNLDLFITNYLDFTVKGNKKCFNALGERGYCSPELYLPVPDRLFRNKGNGLFSDVTLKTGLGAVFGRGLGVTCGDFNSDGWIDIYVANDGTANQLWANQGEGEFEDVALISGTAYNANGLAEAGMGVSAGDIDNDGDEDLFVTHLTQETHTLYVNSGVARFHDATIESGLAVFSRYTGFGAGWFDYDNDGDLDLFVANGAVYPIEALRGETFPYHQKNQLFRNEGNGKFQDVSDEAGHAFQLSEVSRGAAFGDIDNDGDLDIVVANENGPARLMRNEIGSRLHWLEVRLEGVTVNRNGIGAKVGVLRDGHSVHRRHAHSDGSYLSSNDSRVHFGLGQDGSSKTLVVQWPGGHGEIWKNVQADTLITLREGSGEAWSEP